jgi:protein phosphatase methylesterase 1
MKINCVICLARLSFALSASKIKEKARVVAMDLRGHGKTSTENELDLSVEVLIIFLVFNLSESDSFQQGHVSNLLGFMQAMCNDFFAVVKAMYGDSPPAIVLVGHRLCSFC